jgi:hypothetical protein
VIESYEAGEWNFEDFANLVVGPGCSSGFGKYEKAIDLSPGSLVRLRVYTSRWSVATVPATAGAARDVVLTVYDRTLLTPATTRVTIADISGNANAGIEFVSYEEESLESIFKFRVLSDISYRGVSAFRTSRGLSQITMQPPALGYLYRVGTTFEIRVRRDSIQWDLTQFEIDLNGFQGINPFTKTIKVDFTWR